MKKIFLTSAICMIVAMPSYADIASDASSATCDNATIGATENDTDLEAQWSAIEYECNPGQFFNKTNQQCTTCPAGSYCEGGIYTMDDENEDWVSGTAGQYLCSYNDENFTLSAAGNDSGNWCYRNGTVSCSALNPYTGGHGTASYANANASYKAYADYGDPDDPAQYAGGYYDMVGACAYTLRCDAGYTATTVGPLAAYVYSSTLWNEDLIRYKSLNGSSSNLGNQTGLSAGQWEVKWSDGTTVSGMATCSTTAGEWVGSGEGNTTLASNALTAGDYGTETSGGKRYCWCNMGNYSVAGGATQSVASPSWVFAYDVNGSASNCTNDCANACANRVQNFSGFRAALFGGLGANPTCQANTITIDWNPANGEAHTTNQCTYGGSVTLPATPTRPGYVFGGWKVVTTNN